MNPNHSGSSRRSFSRGAIPKSRSRISFPPHQHHAQRNHGQWYKEMENCYSHGAGSSQSERRMDMTDRRNGGMGGHSMDRHISNHYDSGEQSQRGSDYNMDTRTSLDISRGINSMRDRISPFYNSNHMNSNSNNINMNSNSNMNSHSHHSHSNSSHNSHHNHQTPSPPYFTENGNGIKSDSPSRKRRRVSSRMPSQSPPAVWEHRRSPRSHPPNNMVQMQQGSPPIRRPRLREQHQHQQQQQPQQQQQQQPQRSWEPLPAIFQQTTPPHQPPPLVVDINQVPVSLPLRHEPIWTYSTAPHISLCSGHPPPPPPHIPPPCQMHHSMYSQPFAQTCGIGNHFGGFTSSAPPIPVPQAHQTHYQHAQIQQQRPDNLGMDGLDQQHPGTPPIHHHHVSALSGHMHSSPQMAQVSPPQPIFISTEARTNQMGLLHRTARRAIAAPRRNYARFHWPPQPQPQTASAPNPHPHPHRVSHQSLGPHHQPTVSFQTASPYPGLLYHLLLVSHSILRSSSDVNYISYLRAMLPPMFPLATTAYDQAEISSPDSPETENYEALLSLAERLGEAKPRGLARPEIDQLPSYKFNADTHTGDQTSCVVCMCDFEARQTLRVLPCSHEFHAKCIDKWLRTNRTCPICRGNASDYFESSEEQ